MRDGPRPIVAVVDDDQAVRESLRFLLETAGFDVIIFSSADQVLKTPIGGPVCMLIDQNMPRMTGVELLRRLRERGCKLPVALMTGSPSPDLAQRARALGAAAVMEKPLRYDMLLEFVARAEDGPVETA